MPTVHVAFLRTLTSDLLACKQDLDANGKECTQPNNPIPWSDFRAFSPYGYVYVTEDENGLGGWEMVGLLFLQGLITVARGM
jgi:hypothetical protein